MASMGVPTKYICSLDDLIKKRRNTPRIEIKRDKYGLSDETVEAVWKRFKEGEKYEQ